jgi:hypothetical protein
VNLQSRIFGSQSVRRTQEVVRIAGMPRRVWTEEESNKLAVDMTRELKTPKGRMRLRPVQAVALYEAMESRGLFGPIRVGHGKTLISMLISFALEAKRPLLLLPASLVEKTQLDRNSFAEHWRLPTNLQLLSYEMLGLVQSADRLDYIKPDLIVADECHALKNTRAGRTRRVARYMQERPETMFVALSGTVMKSSILDFGHIVVWCLKDRAPVPRSTEELKEWSEALDEKINPLSRRRPGAIFDLAPSRFSTQNLSTARQVFQDRLLSTRGVVASSKTDTVVRSSNASNGADCTLSIHALDYEPSETTRLHVDKLRKTWTTPDDWPFAEAIEFRRYMRELALGFHGIWDPRPPPEWLLARKAWFAFVREILSKSRSLDTMLQVAHAVDDGSLKDGSLLATWRQIEPSFVPNPVPVWHDDSALIACQKWMTAQVGIVWTEHVFFAERLAQMTGADYYGAGALNLRGESISKFSRPGATVDRSIIASVDACRTGQNLQIFDKNLVTSFPSNSDAVEQLLGRTHRDGQESDEVRVDVLLGCSAHFDAFDSALGGARATADTIGHDQKLLLATIAFPVSVSERTGSLWR